jgi:hypothetical protein
VALMQASTASTTSVLTAIGPKPTSSATPSMPSASPRILRHESFSPSQIAPQMAANQGAAALSMAM